MFQYPGHLAYQLEDDYRQEVTQGEIVWTRQNEVVVHRHDGDIGDILVHYPKQGYRLAVDA